MIVKVNNKKQLKAFIDFPHKLYKDDPMYVPELFIAQRDLLTPGKHPFHEHSAIQTFLAIGANEEVKGRIAAILNKNHNSFNNANDGFFGFFECIEDEEVAQNLFDAARNWLKEQGVSGKMIGPVSPSTNEVCALQIDGFNEPPVIMTPYNKAYYQTLFERNGFTKLLDTVAYKLMVAESNKRSVQLEEALLKRLAGKGITIRTVNPAGIKHEAAKVKEVYNKAWDKNMGFVPFTDSEFQYLAKDLKLILDKEFCLIAEHNGEAIGFALGLPNLNEPLKKVTRGRLFPFGIFKLLLGIKRVKAVRILALGVTEPYRKMGIEACFYAAIIRRAVERNMLFGEASWILEDNEMMNKGIQSINGKIYKRYRIYERTV